MKTLVVDANCFIEKFASLKNMIGKYNIVTTKSVYDEIKDPKSIQNLQLYLPDLKYHNASPKSINRVIKFAKETGDYIALS